MREMRNSLEETVGGEASERGSRGRERQRRQRQSAIDVSARTVCLLSGENQSAAPSGHMSAKSQYSREQHRK